MCPTYINFNDYSTVDNFPTTLTEEIGAKIDSVYNKYEENPVTFKKYINKLLHIDPINNVFLIA
jgi:hypothetical protein